MLLFREVGPGAVFSSLSIQVVFEGMNLVKIPLRVSLDREEKRPKPPKFQQLSNNKTMMPLSPDHQCF